ncbi:MAG: DUF2971 domain-containing protein [Bacteroidota bacterium]
MFFKFYNIPDFDIANKIIGQNPTIKFASAFNLNDPYELKFNLKIDPESPKQRDDFFKYNPEKTEKDFLEWKKRITPNFIWYTEQEQRNGLAQTITLSSFTYSNKNNLMWSHYTNNHTGICVEYSKEMIEFLTRHENFFASDNVAYSKNPPVVDNTEDISIKIKKMMFNKQLEWKYENEFRIVLRSDENTDFIPIDRNFIKRVYIGSKCNLSTEIVELCKKLQTPVSYAITIGDSYDVKFSEYKENSSTMRAFWG